MDHLCMDTFCIDSSVLWRHPKFSWQSQNRWIQTGYILLHPLLVCKKKPIMTDPSFSEEYPYTKWVKCQHCFPHSQYMLCWWLVVIWMNPTCFFSIPRYASMPPDKSYIYVSKLYTLIYVDIISPSSVESTNHLLIRI